MKKVKIEALDLLTASFFNLGEELGIENQSLKWLEIIRSMDEGFGVTLDDFFKVVVGCDRQRTIEVKKGLSELQKRQIISFSKEKNTLQLTNAFVKDITKSIELKKTNIEKLKEKLKFYNSLRKMEWTSSKYYSADKFYTENAGLIVYNLTAALNNFLDNFEHSEKAYSLLYEYQTENTTRTYIISGDWQLISYNYDEIISGADESIEFIERIIYQPEEITQKLSARVDGKMVDKTVNFRGSTRGMTDHIINANLDLILLAAKEKYKDWKKRQRFRA